MIKVFCDGGSRSNPGHAAFGFVVKDNDKIIKRGQGYLGIATNNFAEYTAVIKALAWLKTGNSGKDLDFYLDSQLAVSQLNGLYKIKNANIRELVFKVRQLETNFKQVTYTHIPRAQNSEADTLVNLALDEHLYK